MVIHVYQDDVCIGTRLEKDLEESVQEVLPRLHKAGMKLNTSKCVLKSKEITFLGYRLKKEGIQPDARLVEKIKSIRRPENKKELESFLGLSNYYGRCISKYAERIEPLTNLREKSIQLLNYYNIQNYSNIESDRRWR